MTDLEHVKPECDEYRRRLDALAAKMQPLAPNPYGPGGDLPGFKAAMDAVLEVATDTGCP